MTAPREVGGTAQSIPREKGITQRPRQGAPVLRRERRGFVPSSARDTGAAGVGLQAAGPASEAAGPPALPHSARCLCKSRLV